MLFVVVLSFAGSREHALAAQIRTTTTAATPETTTPSSNTTTSPPQSITEATATASPVVDVPGGTTDAQGEEEEEASVPWEELVLLLGEMTEKSTASSYSEDWPNIPDVWGYLQDILNDKMDQIYSLWNNTDFQL